MTMTWNQNGKTRMIVPCEGLHPTERAQRYREALDMFRPQIGKLDELVFKDVADFGNKFTLDIPSSIIKGEDNAVWKHQIQIDANANKPKGTCGFLLNASNVFLNMTFEFEGSIPQEDHGGIGWNKPGDFKAIFQGCKFWGGKNFDWVFYDWEPGRKFLTMVGCYLKFCRQGVSLCSSGSGLTYSLTINDTQFDGVADNSDSIGASSDPKQNAVISPIVMRSGSCNLNSVKSNVYGLTKPYSLTHGPKTVVGLVSDRYSDPGQPCTFNIGPGCKAAVQGNTAIDLYDIINERSVVKITRQEGMNPDGSFKVFK